MGREVRRVPLDFNWPLHKVWEGFINDRGGSSECTICGGTGRSPQAQFLYDQWYGSLQSQRIFWPRQTGSTDFLPTHPAIAALAKRKAGPEGSVSFNLESKRLANLYNVSWSHHLDEHDVAALLKEGRLMDFTHTPRSDEQRKIVADKVASGGNSWLPESNGYVPTPAEVNEWSLSGFGHDSINCWICVDAKCKRLRYPRTCAACKGEGEVWDSPQAKRYHNAWRRTEPPKGEGFQIWETVSEGSPVSPVFATPEELATWMSTPGNDDSVTRGGTYGQWLNFIGVGWAPSFMSSNGSIKDGVTAVAEGL